ncbi:MAG: hypothetical protein Q4B91_03195 [Atopobiaceae bacterium]|nr:hypothetical protein [Atopobiaceae bacterium]
MAKHIFVTSGVVSSLGKGITAASLGRLLKARGYRVTMQKADPYLNVDPGIMSPFQHGEVFVTEDGYESDLDLGHYERFIDENLTRESNFTTGAIYQSLISRERAGDFLGGTVQVTPHPVIDIMPDQAEITEKGGTMRLGAYPCRLEPGTLAAEAYGEPLVWERHRHRYEVSNAYRVRLAAAGLRISGLSPDGRLVEMVELPEDVHPWFVASQAHPEFKSRPDRPAPLFREFVRAAIAHHEGRDRHDVEPVAGE